MISQNKLSSHHGMKDFSRRDLMKKLMLTIPGIILSPNLVSAFNNPDQTSKKLSEIEMKTLSDFIQIIVPGTAMYCAFIANELGNEFYGFEKYIGILIKNLNESSQLKFSRLFSNLQENEQLTIVEEGTKEGLFRKQVYNGAIYILQLIVFAGLCEQDQSCSIIDFPGTNRGPFITYDHYDQINVKSIGINGNPI